MNQCYTGFFFFHCAEAGILRGLVLSYMKALQWNDQSNGCLRGA